MREQAMAGQRVGVRAGAYGKRSGSAATQRPTKRGGGSSESLGARLRSISRYLPLIGKFVLLLLIVVLCVTGYRAAASASFFQVHKVEVQGVTRASSADIQAVVRRLTSQNGLWRADVAAISAQLERLPWVRTAIVTRVLPDTMRIRITEREQRAVIRNAAGRFVWVDDDAVMLGEMLPTDQPPAFFLRGWNEDKSESAISGNRERVSRYLELTREWVGAGLADRVSEVNLMDLRDVRVQLTGGDSQIELRLGAQDFGKRLRKGLSVLDDERQGPNGPFISYIDLTQGTRIFVGLASGTKISSEDGENRTEDESKNRVVPPKPAQPRPAVADRSTVPADGTGRPRRTGKATH